MDRPHVLDWIGRPQGTILRKGARGSVLVPALLCALACFGLASGAAAAEPQAEVDSATRASARKLGYEGVRFYQAEDYRAATDRLERAYRMLKAPSLALWSARALEKAGKFVEASERYLEATRLPIDAGGEPKVQKEAQVSAALDRKKLLPRIPSLLLQVEGVEPHQVTLSIAGEKIPSEIIGSERPINPGDAVIEATYGEQVVRKKLLLMEGENKVVLLSFEPNPAQGAASPTVTVSDAAPERTWQRPLGWATLGVGAAGLLLGGVSGIIALANHNPQCPQGDCEASVDEGEMKSHNTLRTTSIVGLYSGAALAISGAALLLSAPRGAHSKKKEREAREEGRTGVRVLPVVGVGSVGLVGRF